MPMEGAQGSGFASSKRASRYPLVDFLVCGVLEISLKEGAPHSGADGSLLVLCLDV